MYLIRFPPAACLADVYVFTPVCLSPPLSLPLLCVCVSVVSFGKEYVTVGQLNQMYGMPKVESSPTSPLHQSLQSGAVDPAFSCFPSLHGSSLSLSAEVCAVVLPNILFCCICLLVVTVFFPSFI